MTPLQSAVTRWGDFLSPVPSTLDTLQRAGAWSSQLTPCGAAWDAVVIAPLQRGLAALDVLALSVDAGFAVTADYTAQQLVVQVATGSGKACEGLPGVRVLGHHTYVLLPTRGSAGTPRAARLGPPSDHGLYVDGRRLREALVTADAERSRPR